MRTTIITTTVPRTLAILGVLLLASRDAAAQFNVARFDSARSRVFGTFGLDPAIVGSVGIGRVVSPFGHHVHLVGELGLAGSRDMGADDARFRFGLQSSLAQWKSLHVTGSVLAIARTTENTVYRGYNFGADLAATVGVHRPRWFAAGEIGRDKAVITHVRHTSWYRNTYYAGAKDGWYLDAGGTVRYGVAAGVAKGNVELSTRVGVLKTEKYNALMPPGYATVGVALAY
jgi:hypothetical protein